MKHPQKINSLEALNNAHSLAIAPFLFQASSCLLKFEILSFLEDSGKNGASLASIVEHTKLTEYAVETLLQIALALNLVEQKEENYYLAKTGWFLLNDPLVKVNFAFTRDVCYRGLENLDKSFLEQRPAGLGALGNWPTIYPALTTLPEPARKSWFDFDHFYSDAAFKDLAKYVLEHFAPKKIFDVGGNTGKWSMLYASMDPTVEIKIHDLPEQCLVAEKNIQQHGLSSQISTVALDILKIKSFPYSDADVWLMSQFLDCFHKDEITSILKKVRMNLAPNSRLLILEPFIGNQPFEIGDLCLAAMSLYFTAIANGTSRFYQVSEFEKCIEDAGLVVEEEVGPLGTGHTLLICRTK
ncbi:methyltransferase [Turicimonas muris]|uniref:methyltransferase n=5 Tax=Turicimonas muris TaxID=1796652 RepID=UPI0023EFAE80|nr:methyltransferase [Turicimonas muris]